METLKTYFTIDFEIETFDGKVVDVKSRLKLPRPKGRPKKEDMQIVTDPFGKLNQVANFLVENLSNGPRSSVEVFVDAEEMGFSKKAVYKAGRLLNIQKWPIGHGKDVTWMWGILGDEKDVAGS